jgi:hypothetical protein
MATECGRETAYVVSCARRSSVGKTALLYNIILNTTGHTRDVRLPTLRRPSAALIGRRSILLDFVFRGTRPLFSRRR